MARRWFQWSQGRECFKREVSVICQQPLMPLGRSAEGAPKSLQCFSDTKCMVAWERVTRKLRAEASSVQAEEHIGGEKTGDLEYSSKEGIPDERGCRIKREQFWKEKVWMFNINDNDHQCQRVNIKWREGMLYILSVHQRGYTGLFFRKRRGQTLLYAGRTKTERVLGWVSVSVCCQELMCQCYLHYLSSCLLTF